MALFLASDGRSFMTGSEVFVMAAWPKSDQINRWCLDATSIGTRGG
jgi:hypothetical protein